MSDVNKKVRETTQFLDNLTKLITDDRRETSEIVESLRAQGIDPTESIKEFHRLLSEHSPTWQEKAARARAAVVTLFTSRTAKARKSRAEIVAEIRRVIDSMRDLGSPVEAGAYHRKFEGARDEDLESLLEDLSFQRDLLLKQRGPEKSDA